MQQLFLMLIYLCYRYVWQPGLLQKDYVDVFGIVYEMRRERVWMVQTEQQYICIHQCVLAVFEGKENDGIGMREVHDNEGYEGKIPQTLPEKGQGA